MLQARPFGTGEILTVRRDGMDVFEARSTKGYLFQLAAEGEGEEGPTRSHIYIRRHERLPWNGLTIPRSTPLLVRTISSNS
jgi:hypothetical protein